MSTIIAPIYQAALDRGLSITPVNGKAPILRNWQRTAVNDASIMGGHTGNYGVVANEEFCILDVDNPEACASLLPQLPRTYTVRTRRGSHHYFKHTEKSSRLGNQSLGVLDFWATDKQVVGEGSVHESGHVYTCTDDSPIATIPDELVAAIAAIESERKSTPNAPKHRQDMLAFCGGLWDGSQSEDELLASLIEKNEHMDIPLSLGDLQRMAHSCVTKWEPATAGPTAVIGRKLELVPDKKKDRGPFQYPLGPHGNDKHGVFGTRRVNAIFGASGAGKTTLAVQMLEAQEAKQTFLGRAGAGWPYLVIWQDRGAADLEEQLHNLGFLNGIPPNYHVVSEQERAMGPAAAIEQIYLRMGNEARVVYVEGVDLWLQDACNSKEVSAEVHRIRSVAEHYDLSVIVSLGAPKAKAKEGYVAARDRIIGTSTWARVLSTVMEVKEREADHRRLVSLLPRSDRPQAVQMDMVDGRLVEYQGIEVQISDVAGSKKDAIFGYLNEYPDATPETLAKAFTPMSRTAAYRWVARWENPTSSPAR